MQVIRSHSTFQLEVSDSSDFLGGCLATVTVSFVPSTIYTSQQGHDAELLQPPFAATFKVLTKAMSLNFLKLALAAVGVSAIHIPRQDWNDTSDHVFNRTSNLTSNQNFNWSDTKHLIAFGDSYSYVQGQLGLTNASWIGSAANLSYTPEELLSNAIVQSQTSTAEGGPNWVEHLTKCGLETGLTLPQSCEFQLWDFAFGGADVSNAYTPNRHWTVSVWNQTDVFIEYAQPTLKEFVDPDQTLVTVWIGTNDVGDSETDDVSFPVLYETMIGTLFEQVQKVHDSGKYRNFLFMNLPPLDRTQANLIRAAGPLPNKTMIDEWNTVLANHSSAFERRNPGVKSMLFDANGFLNGVLDDPKTYNISNTTSYCPSYNQPAILTDPGQFGCLPLDEYFWFNSIHLTSHTHELLASAVNTFLESESL